MRIIEGFSDYFVSCLEKSYNQTPKTVDVLNITVERKLGTTGIHMVKVQLESDLGGDEASIAVKIYDEQEQALEVVKRINILENRLSQKKYSHFGISSAAVIFFSRSVIVMEGIQGDVFRESKIPRPQKYRYAGRGLAARGLGTSRRRRRPPEPCACSGRASPWPPDLCRAGGRRRRRAGATSPRA